MENENNYEKVINTYINVLYKKNDLPFDKQYELAEATLVAMDVQFSNYYEYTDENRAKQLDLVKRCIKYIIPYIEKKLLDKKLDTNTRLKFYNLYGRAYRFCGKRSFKHFLLAMEFKKRKKVFNQRMKLFAPLVYYMNKMALEDDVSLLRISMPPRIC